MPVLWIAEDYCSTPIRRSGSQSESHSAAYAGNGNCRDLPWSEFEQTDTKRRDLSLSFASYNQPISQSYLGIGYHLHPLARRLDVSRSGPGLVFTLCDQLGAGSDIGTPVCLDGT